MATQIYDVQWNDSPAEKPILSKPEIVAYARHFGQDTKELHEFLSRFDFEDWICMELFVDYVYGKVDKNGEVGSDAVAFLNIVSGTFFTEEAELALKNYIGFDNRKFEYNSDGSPPFATFPDCPLWILQVTRKQKQSSGAIFFMPAIWWKDAEMTSESYGDSHFAVNARWNSWYNDPFGKNQQQNMYWRNRIGSYSPNFIERESGPVIHFDYQKIHFDALRNRVLVQDSQTDDLLFYDLPDFRMEHKTNNFLKGSANGFIESSADGYRFYTGAKVSVVDADFSLISDAATKLVNQFEDDFWKVELDGKGVLMTRKDSGEEKRFKYSELKLTASAYSNNPDSLKIFVNANKSVLFFGNHLSIIDVSFKVTNLDLRSMFRKEMAPYYFGNAQKPEHVALSSETQLLLTEYGIFETGSDEKPINISGKLKEITGEVSFYNAIKDEDLNGIWFISGIDRLVFTDENLDRGYVFNFTEQDLSHEEFNGYRWSNMFFDKEGNLWYSLFGSTLYKITRNELESKLKTAVAYSSKQP